MKISRVLGVLFCALVFLNPAFSAESDIVVAEAWTRASNSKTSASYMQIMNHQKKDVVLLSVTSDVASIVELHKTVTENNISQMVHINRLVIPANHEVILKPKGLHVMLIGLKQKLEKGDVVSLTLNFENEKPIMVNTVVK